MATDRRGMPRLDGAKYGGHVNKRDSWGPALAALVLGLLAIMVVGAFYLGIRGLL